MEKLLATTVCLNVLTEFCTASSVEYLLQHDVVKEECNTGDEELQLVQKNAQKHVSKGKTAGASQTQNLFSLSDVPSTTMMEEYHPRLLGRIVTLPPGVMAPGQKPAISDKSAAGDFKMMMRIGKRMAVITGVLFFVFSCAIGSYIWFFAQEKIEGALTMKAEMNTDKAETAEYTAKNQQGDDDVINEGAEDDDEILPLEGKKDNMEHSDKIISTK